MMARTYPFSATTGNTRSGVTSAISSSLLKFSELRRPKVMERYLVFSVSSTSLSAEARASRKAPAAMSFSRSSSRTSARFLHISSFFAASRTCLEHSSKEREGVDRLHPRSSGNSAPASFQMRTSFSRRSS